MEQETRISYLLLPSTAMWCDAQAALSTLEGVGNWDIDFCLAVDDDCGMISQDRSATICTWRCYLVKRIEGQWVPPTACKLKWNGGAGAMSADLENYVDSFRPGPSISKMPDGSYVPSH